MSDIEQLCMNVGDSGVLVFFYFKLNDKQNINTPFLLYNYVSVAFFMKKNS